MISAAKFHALVLGGAMALGASAVPSFAQHNWDAGTSFPPSNFLVQGLQEFARRVNEATNGQVAITVHAGGAIGLQGPDAMRAVKDGIVAIAEGSFSQQTGVTPLSFLGDVPMLAVGYDQTKQFRDALGPLLAAKEAELNQKVLYMAPWPGQGFYTKNPINQLSDLRGVKIRAGSGSAFDFLAALGASPAMLPWGEVTPALATGAIQGVITSSQSGVDGKFWEFLGYYYSTDYTNPLSVVTVNLDAWKALTPELQAAIEKVAAEIEPEIWQASKDGDAKARATLTENGIKIVTPSEEFMKQAYDASAKLREDALAKAGPDGPKLIEAIAR